MVKTPVVATYFYKEDSAFGTLQAYADPNEHYGIGVWEGMRCNKGSIFRLDDHINRLINSARITCTPFPWDEKKVSSKDEIKKGILEAARQHAEKSGKTEFYIRPAIGYDKGEMGLDQSENSTNFRVVTWPWEDYHKKGVIDSGIDVIISEYPKMCGHPEMFKAKTPPNYALSVMEKVAAKKKGYLDALFLDAHGSVAEATGANIFFAYSSGEFVCTPSEKMPEILNGITRDSIIQLFDANGIQVVKVSQFNKYDLFAVKEVFLTGTASRIVPVVSITDVDGCKHVIGDGKPGTLTKEAYELYLSAIHGEISSFGHWLTKVE